MRNDISQLERIQIDKLKELGSYLREVREEHFLSLEQVSGKTMIQPRLLRAIEEGKLHQLPEPVYIQGFIKRYAEALGLDGTAFAAAFPLQPDIRAVQPSWHDSPAAQLRPIHLYAAYVLVIIAAVSTLSYLMRGSIPVTSRLNTPSPSAPASSGAAVSNRTASVATTNTNLNLPERMVSDPARSNKPVRVDIILTAQSWLRVDVDGKTQFQGILPEGTQKTWTADSEVTVRAGNAGGVMLTYNDGQPTRMGEPGTVKEVTFSVSQQAASLPAPKPFTIR